MPSPASTTQRALLGLLSIRAWTAYDLTRQMRRALRWAWPRSEANLYREVKRLVPNGFATATEEGTGRRSRTKYAVTDRGREEVSAWLESQPPAPPQVEFEALLRLFLADQGTVDQLRRTIAETRQQILERLEEGVVIAEDYLHAPPFPERAHLNVLFMHFSAGFARLVLSWCDDVEAEIDTWPGTATAVGLTPGTRRMLEETLAYYRTTLDQYNGEH
ncbi:helix-turn-helix transcriptional regulator [Demequina muriae]|uniref:Helix-turn-helix transcriptional regulator n=1 Tax=Demequina muriae TaxID=3051664 RepID=A0ABT8GEZ7_9MICO|nr:helix-turn-helix transcriptional regulator [Demequina sp. EGI L300058]MDN4479919.1 helix-turn-helix transcriptional regulator [Demequina sp. EGI L300058]